MPKKFKIVSFKTHKAARTLKKPKNFLNKGTKNIKKIIWKVETQKIKILKVAYTQFTSFAFPRRINMNRILPFYSYHYQNKIQSIKWN